MKYFCFFVVAVVFGSAGWLLRGEWTGRSESDELVEVSFPLNVKQDAMQYLEGEWHYKDSSALILMYSGDFVLFFFDDMGAVSGTYSVDGMMLFDLKTEIRVRLADLKYSEELLERIEQDSVNDPLGDGSVDDDFFNEKNLRGCFVITQKKNGDTLMQVTDQNWIAVEGKEPVKLQHK